MMSKWSLISGGIVALSIGCTPQPAVESKPAAPAKAESKPAESAKPGESDNDVVVTTIDADGLQTAVAKHAGKVVLVDCWATYCTPCMKEFPKTVELGRQHADQGLVVMSLSFDDPVDGQAPNKVRGFLKKQGAAFEHYISTLDLATKEAQEAFAIEEGSLPHYKLYDRTGKLIRSFGVMESAPGDAPELHETIAAAVAEALEAK